MERHRVLWEVNDDLTTLKELSRTGTSIGIKERKDSLEIRLNPGEYMIYVNPDRDSRSPVLQEQDISIKVFRKPTGDFYTLCIDDEKTLFLAKPKTNLNLSISIMGVPS